MRLLFTIIHVITLSCLVAQTQVGDDLLGQSFGNHFGSALSLSADGSRMIVGAWRSNEFGNESGRVQIFEENDGSWSAVIGALNGESSGQRFGYAVSISADGNRIAVGAPNARTINGAASGQVTILAEVNDTWLEIGAPIIGKTRSENFGNALALSADGRRLAVRTFTAGLGGNAGVVRIFEEVNGTWIQMGVDLPADNDADSNTSLALSADGTSLAIGASSGSSGVGQVVIYKDIDGTWTNSTSFDGDNLGDGFGVAVSLSANGSRVAIGIPGMDAVGQDAGQIRIYEEIAGDWLMISRIEGQSQGDRFGTSIALSDDGTRVAVGAPKNDENEIDAGQVSLFEEAFGNWEQLSSSLNGEFDRIEYGSHLDLSASGERVGIGAWKNDQNGTDAGLVQVYEGFGGCSSTNSIDSIQACESHIWIDGNRYTTSNNSATYTLTNAAGCDSVVTLNLNISYPSDIDPTLTNNGATLTANESGATYQWITCAGFRTIAGATGQSFTPTESDTYAVIIRKGGCEVISACQSIIITSIEDVLQEAGVAVFPNPGKDYFFIKGIEKLERPMLRNTLGQVVIHARRNRIDIAELPVGTYFLTAYLEEQFVSIRLVKN